MFKLKYPASTSSPSLSSTTTSTSAPSTPIRPSRSSTCALSVLQQQRQQNRISPLLNARTRTTSLLPISPRRPPPPPFTSSPNTARKKVKAKTATAVSAVLGEDVTLEDASMVEPAMVGSSFSHQSMLISEEDEERILGGSSAQDVVVCVRVRPASEGNKDEIWSMDESRNRITPTDSHPTIAKRGNTIGSPSKTTNSCTFASQDSSDKEKEGYDFQFDSLVLPCQNTNEMYESNISPIVDAVVSGYNGTVFAYGQTGSGKTHTMSGTESEMGVIPRAVEQIFQRVEKESQREFLLRVSYLEIYNEALKDLLAPYPSSASCTDLTARPASPTKGGSSHVAGSSSSSNSDSSLRILEAGGRIQIQGLREEIVTNSGEVLNLLEWGQRGRHQAATDWNERSSRSHCVFILTLESREPNKENNDVRFSQLNLIDLAGSERAATEKERRKEGAFINKSLLTLGTVIAKLSDQCQTGNEDGHIPYRDSKLTRLLQTSLGGNARVAVVCTLSPMKEHAVESMSTLRFGQRCKMVVTKAKKGTIVNDKALIARYKKELERLRNQLEQGNSTVEDVSVMVQDDSSIKELQSRREEVEKDVKTMNEKRDELKKQVEHLTRLILTGKNVAADNSQGNRLNSTLLAGSSRRMARRSDLGTSSPSKRQKIFDNHREILAPLYDDQENSMTIITPFIKPFALESEMASLRKNLASAMAGRQASEDARVEETQLWKARIMELEAVNTEQEEELDEAEVAFEKLKNERDTLRSRVEEQVEANRLLQLVVKSRGSDIDSNQKLLLEQSQRDVDKLRVELQVEMQKHEQLRSSQGEQMKRLKEQLSVLQQNLDEEKGKDETITALQEELFALKSSHGEASSLLEELNSLRLELQKALEEKEEAQQDLIKANLEHEQEDAERDFADLVKGDSSSSSATDKQLQESEKKLQDCNREIKLLEKELQECKQKIKPLPVPSIPASPSIPDNLRIVMEKQLKSAEEKCKALEQQNAALLLKRESIKTPSSPLKSSTSRLNQLVEGDQPIIKSVGGGRTSLQRGGSMREYKRYSLANEIQASTNNVVVEQAVKAEREEIERLNNVINSQRSIMSDLEGSVAAWKNRLRLQHDIITRLVEAAGDHDKIILTDVLTPSTASTTTSSSTNNEKRASSCAQTAMTSSSPSPYYGAHTFNKAPNSLGLGSTSPTKGVGWIATMPGVRPDPLPLPNLLSSPSSRSKRRVTIENEIEELKGSPRVKSTTDRLLEPKSSRPLPIPGSPAKVRPSRDYYI